MSSVMKIDLEISTEKAKKSLQQLAKDTSKNLQIQQNRTQQQFQRGQQQQGGKGHSNLLGLAALGTSMVALSNTTKKQSEELVKNTKDLQNLDKEIVRSSSEINELGKEIEVLTNQFKNLISGMKPAYFKSMSAREDYRAYLAHPDNGEKPLRYKQWALREIERGREAIPEFEKFWMDELEKADIHYDTMRKGYGARLRRRSNLNLRRSYLLGRDSDRGLLKNLTPLQERGLGIRNWLSDKALGLNTRLGGLPLIGRMLGGIGTSMSGAISSIPSSMLGGLGAAGTVASYAAIPLALGVGGYMAGKTMINNGRQAQSQREQLNASLGQMQFNMSGTRDVSELTDNIMRMSISGVNSVQDLNAATSALMMSFEGNTDKVQEFLPLIDDLAAATGVTATQMGEMIARVNEAGVAESRVINSLSTKGIPIYRALGEAMGVTTQEAKKMAKEGTISAAIFEKALQNLGKTVKGTSAALSSMTIEGAKNSFEAAESLAYASSTEAADRSRIDMLNNLTDETMKEVENNALQQIRAAAGHGAQAIENFGFQLWDDIGDFFTDLGGTVLVVGGAHSAASSSLNREINKRLDELQEVTDEMGSDAIN